MALSKLQDGASKIYLSIREGKVARKDGDQWVLYNSVAGRLHEVGTRENKFGEQECFIVLDDLGERYQLQVKQGSSYFRAFASMANNIDVDAPLEFVPMLREENGKKNVGLILMQNGKAVKWAHTKNEPNGMPGPEVMTKKSGEKIYDWSERDAFLMDRVNALNARIGNVSEVESSIPDIEDDLPF